MKLFDNKMIPYLRKTIQYTHIYLVQMFWFYIMIVRLRISYFLLVTSLCIVFVTKMDFVFDIANNSIMVASL